ncbi:NAD(P)H-quinone oxidoreductase [Methylobrevis albus]|uniref:NAD(P)H-quinone oxidoreductase n=1 Tax=Methylobrevis albus TaxID=2793297 RepID=A0A931I0M3_9HYPH|nr:NAD(P)H-quinone oxidoreductase [Methylobrevis albus]MBH0237155.1 NAD(P)H-quinone oxidoreductase [Methylobrevis albus]
MTAIEITAPGGPEVLRATTRPVPTPGPGEVLLRVEAAGVNRPDALQRAGAYPPPKGASDIPGLEVAGEVVAVGDGVTRWQLGDRVTALVTGGGYAEYCAVPEGSALPFPDGYDAVKAASLPETFFTVWSNVFDRAGLRAGERFLVHGGTSGIGTTAIQLAKAFGATVYTTAGSDEKCAVCRGLGADLAVNYRSEDFVAAVKAASEGKGADVILDMVGGSYIARNHEAAAIEGRIVQIAFLQGSKVEVDFTRLMLKRLVHTGSTLRAREPDFKAAIARELEGKVWPLLSAGSVAPVIDTVLPLADAAEAHRLLEADHVGKIILVPGAP